MKSFATFALVVAVAAAAACGGKKDDKALSGSGSGSGSGSAAAPVVVPPVVPPPAVPAASLHDEAADYISAYATHKEPKPIDPVEVNFSKFSVTKAKFDTKNLEGGTATVEIDLTSLKSPSPKRDDHLRTPAYIDIAKYTTVTIDVDNVKKKSGATYSADAKVKFHGVTKKLPVTFDVIDTKPDSVRIKAEAPFNRVDFQLGKDPSDKDEGVAGSVTLKMQLTLKNK